MLYSPRETPRDLDKPQVLIREVWMGGVSAFLRSSQVMSVLLVQGPGLEGKVRESTCLLLQVRKQVSGR